MLTTISLILANLCYLAIFGFILGEIRHQQAAKPKHLRALLIPALLFHGGGLGFQFMSGGVIALSFFKVPSLLFWLINIIVLLSSLRKPTLNVLLLVSPMSVVAIACTLIFNTAEQSLQLNTATSIHILLSLLAYSLLTIATMQALLLAYQNHQLRNKQIGGMVRLLPPLQTMEALLFELLWVGFSLLSISIVTGILFVDTNAAQPLAHKIFFSVASWLIYATLLFGRQLKGWRGNTAIRFTLGGFIALMLAYFGSKLVLELIL